MVIVSRLSLLLSLVAFAAFGLQTKAEAFSVAFSWAGIPPCQTVSPAFILREVPPGTKRLRFVMRDEQVPSFQHGGSTVPYRGSDAIPRGAIRYIGPCPPNDERHRYQWTIEALDNLDKVLGQASTTAIFPP